MPQTDDLDDAALESEVTTGEVQPEGHSELYEDIKGIDRLGTSLIPAVEPSYADVAAAERGRREHPDGTVEDYERLEFRPRPKG